MDVLEAILTRVPEVACVVTRGCRGPALLAEVLRLRCGEVRLPAIDEDLVDRRKDVPDRLIAAPRRLARMIRQEIARAVVDSIGPDRSRLTVDAQRVEPLRESGGH